MNQTKIDLYKARLLIEKGWTQGASARNIEDRRVDVEDESAICFCAIGAIGRVTESYGSISNRREREAIKALKIQLKKLKFNSGVIQYNDRPERTKSDIVNLFNMAIDE